MQNFIAPSVKMGENCQVGHFSVVYDDVKMGSNVKIGNCTTIYPGTEIGDNVKIEDNCVIGKLPYSAPKSTLAQKKDPMVDLAPLKLAKNCYIGANAIVYRGAVLGEGVYVADLASIRERCYIGNYVIVGRGVTVENDCKIGDNTKLQAEVYITALSELEDNVFVAPCVATTNDNYMTRTEERFKHRKGATFKSHSRIGGNAVILPGVTVGKEGVVGAGSVVTRDVPEFKVSYGNPAKVVREVPEEQLLLQKI